MKKYTSIAIDFLKKSDMFLLLMCIAASVFGIVLIASATRHYESNSFVIVQSMAVFIGILLYFAFSVIDVDIIANKWRILLLFNILFISSLFVFGVAGETGNRAWIRFGGIGIQPAEIVKIPFTIILARQICHLREHRGLSHISSVLQLVLHFGLMFGLIIVTSGDLGSALVYLFIFVVMIFVGGLKLYWFLIAAAGVGAALPVLWQHFFTSNQKERILAPYVDSIDPTGLGVKWQPNLSKSTIAAGHFTGSGLFQGNSIQAGLNPQQHTDFIFSVAGEELGIIGCLLVMLVLLCIIIRCIYVGLKSNDAMGMLVCIGLAAMLIFQTFENIGMCLGLTPVIGLTLPFFSYGGSSIITLFAAMGIVSGVKMRPSPSRFVRL